MNRLLALLSISILACTSAIVAGNGGSGYSRYGIGDIYYDATSRTMGMGGAGLGVLSNNAIDRMNPAAWSRINRVRFSVSALYEGFSTADDRTSAYLAGTQFNGLMLAVPLVQKYGVVFGAGITPFSRVNYHIILPTTQGGYNYDLDYTGDGGTSQGHIGLSGTPTDDLSLGIKFQYYFGTLRHSITQTFTGTTYTNGEVVSSTRMNGVGITVGAIFSGLKHVFGFSESQALNVGFVLSTASNLTMANERYYAYTTSLTTRDTSISPDGTLHFPLAVGGGVAYAGEQILLAADGYYQNWNAATFDGVKDPNLRDSYRLSVGGELTPRRNSDAPFFQRLAYRAGFFYNATYYQVKGQSINELGFTGGFGIPIFSDTRLGIAAEYSFRGTTEQQLQKDRILRISFTLSVGELWFVKPQEE
ncbi:MAG: hypothetical protein HY033_07950 [Ignavibacteriae bacterium]|nr:hypothetical protein [Ignavibacteriota bacterium]